MIQFRHINEDGMFPWSGVYFHGRAEKLVAEHVFDGSAPDLVSANVELYRHRLASDNYTVLSTEFFLKDTFEPCEVYGVPAVLALWIYRGNGYSMARGLIFLEDDNEAREYALKKFRAASQML